LNATQLAKAWLTAKNEEKEANKKRIEIENELLNLPNFESDVYKIKCTQKNTIKIDTENLLDLSRMNDLDMWINKAFRWKPEINKAVYDTLDDHVKNIYGQAITEAPAKPSFTIEIKKGE